MARYQIEGPDGQAYELETPGDSEPTPEIIEKAKASMMSSGSTGGQQAEDQIFTRANIEDDIEDFNSTSPLNPIEHLIFGLAPTPESKIGYLSEKLKGRDVSRDEEGNIRIDGKKVNPKGFQFTADILGNVGEALPIAGQIMGGISGGTAGSALPGAGTVAGAMGGGVAGAAVGSAARSGLARLAGVPVTGQEAGFDIAKESALGLGGEVVTRGAFKAAQVGSKATGFDKMAAKAWKNVMNAFSKHAPDFGQYVGGLSRDKLEIAQKELGGFDKVFQPEYFAEDSMRKITNRTLFGSDKADILALSKPNPNFGGIQRGAIKIAENIKETGNKEFDQLLKGIGNISDDTVNTIKTNPLSQIFSKENLDPKQASRLAIRFSNAAEARADMLGKDLQKKTIEAIEKRGKLPISIDDLGRELDNFIKQSQGNIRVPGFTNVKRKNVPGLDELINIRNELGGSVNGNFRFYGETIKDRAGNVKKVLETPSAKQLYRRIQNVDNHADRLFEKGSQNVNAFAQQWLEKFRNRVFNESLGVGKERELYSAFKTITSEAKLNRGNYIANFENQIKNFGKLSGTQKTAFETVLENIDPKEAAILSRKISLLNAGNDLKNFDTLGASKKLESMFNTESLTSMGKLDVFEETLKNIDRSLKTASKQSVRSKAFLDDVMKTQIARDANKKTFNMLRLQSLMSMTGLGFVAGGPAGALAALAFTQPKNIAMMLSRLERMSKAGMKLPSGVSRGAQRLGQTVPASSSQLLQTLLNSANQQ